MHRYDVDVDAVVWSGTFLGETPDRMSGPARDLEHHITQCASKFVNAIRFGAVLGSGRQSLTHLVVWACKNVRKPVGAGSRYPHVKLQSQVWMYGTLGMQRHLERKMVVHSNLPAVALLKRVYMCDVGNVKARRQPCSSRPDPASAAGTCELMQRVAPRACSSAPLK